MPNDNDKDWKWGQSSRNAFNLIGSVFNISPEAISTVKDSETTKLLKGADASDVQVKRTLDAVRAVKKTWRNQLRIGAAVHGLVRNGLSLLVDQRRQEATTTKEYAKAVTESRVLSAKTQTAVEKTYTKGAHQIAQASKQLELAKGDLAEQYQVLDETAQQQSQQKRIGFRERAQKRLAANARPWRNY